MKLREYVFVCLKGMSHGDHSFKHTEHTIWWKGRAFWFCFGVFLAEMCLECSGGTSHRDVSLEHTEQAFRWEILNNSGVIKFRINQDFLIKHSCILHKIKFIMIF